MKYGIVDGQKTEAIKWIKGFCPCCGLELISKCGDRKIDHWAHKGTRTCDQWWEPETEWHRKWKDRYPVNWQEIVLMDERTGEKHIADVRTDQGFVFEFQHSFINPKERSSRELFYQNMTWVVDGTRLKRDYPRFLKAKDSFKIIRKGIFKVDFPDECFPSAWLESSVPVVFDFSENGTKSENRDSRGLLYCLFPIKFGQGVVVAEISKKAFIDSVINGEWISRINKFIAELIQVSKEREAQIEIQQKRLVNMAFQNNTRSNLFRKGRRF